MARSLVVGAFAVGAGAAAAAFLLQDWLVYHPSRSYGGRTPAWYGLAYEDVWLYAADGVRLHSWFIKHSPHHRVPTVIFFQGNGGNIADRLHFVCEMLHKLHCNVFMLSYRGYGKSDGNPSQDGIIKDAQAALDYLTQRNDINTSRIVVYGRSLGGAVALAITRKNPDKIAALILENTFTSILDMAGTMVPLLTQFIGGNGSEARKILNNHILSSPWSTIDIIGQIKQPILLLSGLNDEVVPPSHMRMLHDRAIKANKRCLLEEFPAGTHMETWISDEGRYWRTIQSFLNQYAPQIQTISIGP